MAELHPKSSRQIAEDEEQVWRSDLETQLGSVRAKIEKLDSEIKQRKNKRDKLRSERDRLTHYLSNGRTFNRDWQHDSHYILCSEFAIYIKRYLDENGKGSLLALSKSSSVGTRTIRDIRNKTRKYISVMTADRLLTAMGIPRVLDTFEQIPKSMVFGRPPKPPESQYYEE